MRLLVSLCLVIAADAATVAEYQILQRGADGKASARFEGQTATASVIEIEARRGSWTRKTKIKVSPGPWSGEVDGLETGGPYRIEARNGAERIVRDNIYVGDLWVLAGQSNMVGRAKFSGAESPDDRVHVLPKDSIWAVAKEPVHELRTGLDGEPIGAGLGLPFAKEMVRRTGVPIGLLPVAVGGTSLWQWEPDDPKSLYAAMMDRIRKAGGKVRGVLWHQGEADSRDDRSPQYAGKFQYFLTALRRDLKDDRLSFYYAQVSRYPFEEKPPRSARSLNRIQETQRLLEENIKGIRMAATIDLELEDHVHLNREGQHRLGRRLANLACRDLFPNISECASVLPGPRLSGVRWESPRHLRVIFTGVNGALRSTGRVLGFSFTDGDGKEQPLIFRASLAGGSGNEVVLQINNQLGFPAALRLWYGRGFDPTCNLTGDRDMAVPVFGPLLVTPPPAK
ncbi:MAG: sialate O-acetylesterase [Bryobacteraceae bacterium]